ncbi:MAG: DUF2892 domain-containing protein [Cyanobacteria bacterium P01_A01_bin.40]
MNKNIGILDRIIRVVIAGILLYLGLGIYVGSTLGIGLAIVSIIPLITSLLGSCPMYSLLGVRTCQGNSQLPLK